MLTDLEAKIREDFYKDIFPNFESIKKRYKYLWPTLKYELYLRDLKNLDFENPKKMIANEPWILGVPIDDIKKKINFLRKCGFKNPTETAEANIKILDFSIHSMKGKLKGLSDIGFEFPKKVFISIPKIICHSTESVRQKILDLGLDFENQEEVIEALSKVL